MAGTKILCPLAMRRSSMNLCIVLLELITVKNVHEFVEDLINAHANKYCTLINIKHNDILIKACRSMHNDIFV